MLTALATIALALAVAAPAAAKPSASATLSTAGSGAFVLTVMNTGSEPFETFGVVASVSNLVPSPPCENRGTSFVCVGTISAGGSKQVCFSASLGAYPSLQVTAGSGGVANEAIFNTTPGPAVSACPVSSGASGGAGAGHAWTRAQCKSAHKAWRKHHAHANAPQRKAEARKLTKEHHCVLALSILK
jgi:hypothetical protein